MIQCRVVFQDDDSPDLILEMLDKASSEEFARPATGSSGSRRNVIEVVDDSAAGGGGDRPHKSGCCS